MLIKFYLFVIDCIVRIITEVFFKIILYKLIFCHIYLVILSHWINYSMAHIDFHVNELKLKTIYPKIIGYITFRAVDSNISTTLFFTINDKVVFEKR